MGVRFTKDEFAVMVEELLYQEPVSFAMLCRIAEKTLRPAVVRWCNAEDCLRGRGYEDDIMQDIHLRLMKITVTYFLLRDDVEGPYNNDPEGFEDWLFRVGENLKRDFANKVRSNDYKTETIEEPVPAYIPEDGSEAEARIERLKQAFSIVLSADVRVYKVLTWLAQGIFMLEQDVTKIESNDLIVAAFEDKTLYEMYAMILAASRKIPWITVSSQQEEKILKALGKPWHGDITYGETKYKAFFMKHDGQISGKKSISDWMYRMNDMIKQKAGSQTDPAERSGTETSGQTGEKKRRGPDETSSC